MLGKIFGKSANLGAVNDKCDGQLTAEQFKALPKAIQQTLSAKETVKVYTLPENQTTRSTKFEFEYLGC